MTRNVGLRILVVSFMKRTLAPTTVVTVSRGDLLRNTS